MASILSMDSAGFLLLGCQVDSDSESLGLH
jgi:hypothetical protein